MNIEKKIREYLTDIIHMSLATSADNKPWICEVHYAYDDELNFYFISKEDRRHSKEIAANPTVAGNIVTQHTLTQKIRGVYFEGMAELLKNVEENHIAYKAYCERFHTDRSILDESKTDAGHKFYKITVHNFYLVDNRESDPGQKYELKWK